MGKIATTLHKMDLITQLLNVLSSRIQTKDRECSYLVQITNKRQKRKVKAGGQGQAE